jgi:predicted site-specific integrase-resolvase
VIEDLGSGMNYQKKGLKTLIKALCHQEVGRLVITHKDRLLRFGSELIFSICSHVGCEVVIINASEDSTYEEDLTRDVLEIIAVFSARLYGSRSYKNRKILESLQSAADEACQ